MVWLLLFADYAFDRFSSMKISGYILGACSLYDYFCKLQRNHLQISSSYLDSLGLKCLHWNNRRIVWRYLQGTAPWRGLFLKRVPLSRTLSPKTAVIVLFPDRGLAQQRADTLQIPHRLSARVCCANDRSHQELIWWLTTCILLCSFACIHPHATVLPRLKPATLTLAAAFFTTLLFASECYFKGFRYGASSPLRFVRIPSGAGHLVAKQQEECNLHACTIGSTLSTIAFV
jgi:hypothetical protein